MFCMKFVCAAVACASAHALPTGCSEDAHCSSGFFCAPAQRLCRQCLRCDELKREPPLLATDCVTSVAECTACFTGFVEDNGSRSAACVSLGALDVGTALPYGLIAAFVALLLVLAVCFAAVYALINFKAYRVFASTLMTAGRSAREVCVTPTAPLPPPPYNTVALLPAADSRTFDTGTESCAPFIKNVRARNERETAGSQVARVFRNPAYVNGVNLPPSYETAARDEFNGVTPSVRELRDEHTMDITNNNIVMTEPHATMTRLLGPSEQPVTHAPATEILRVRQDSNNHSESSGECGEGHARCRSSFLAHNTSPFIINVIKNVTTVQQHNDLTL